MCKKILVSLLTLSCLFGCAFPGGIAYFDNTTYKNLTYLKPEVTMLYESFKEDEVPQKDIKSIKLALAQSYEYEKGKGEDNSATITQFKKIQDIFNRHIKERIEDGKWSEKHCENKIENISEAFDAAIKSEFSKNHLK